MKWTVRHRLWQDILLDEARETAALFYAPAGLMYRSDGIAAV